MNTLLAVALINLSTTGIIFKNSVGYVWSDGAIYSCERPGDDCSDTPIGQLGDENSPIPSAGGIIGTTSDGYVWSNGDVYACQRPGDDCEDAPLRHIELPLNR